MAKKQSRTDKTTELYEALDLQIYAKAYDEIERSQPLLAQTIEKLVANGEHPKRIKAHFLRSYPNRWIESQLAYQAALYCQFALGD